MLEVKIDTTIRKSKEKIFFSKFKKFLRFVSKFIKNVIYSIMILSLISTLVDWNLFSKTNPYEKILEILDGNFDDNFRKTVLNKKNEKKINESFRTIKSFFKEINEEDWIENWIEDKKIENQRGEIVDKEEYLRSIKEKLNSIEIEKKEFWSSYGFDIFYKSKEKIFFKRSKFESFFSKPDFWIFIYPINMFSKKILNSFGLENENKKQYFLNDLVIKSLIQTFIIQNILHFCKFFMESQEEITTFDAITKLYFFLLFTSSEIMLPTASHFFENKGFFFIVLIEEIYCFMISIIMDTVKIWKENKRLEGKYNLKEKVKLIIKENIKKSSIDIFFTMCSSSIFSKKRSMINFFVSKMIPEELRMMLNEFLLKIWNFSLKITKKKPQFQESEEEIL